MSTPIPIPSPIGLIIPPLPVQTTPLAISPTQFAFTLPFPTSSRIPPIVAFLLPGITLPLDTVAAIYVRLPTSISTTTTSTSTSTSTSASTSTSTTGSEFKLVGALSNERPSGVFYVGAEANDSGGAAAAAADEEMIDDDDEGGSLKAEAAADSRLPGRNVTVGISIEAVATIASQLADLVLEHSGGGASSSAVTTATKLRSVGPLQTKELAQRIIKNAFNFLASFSGAVGAKEEEMVPLKSFMDWWAKFERRVENEPGFLEREIDG